MIFNSWSKLDFSNGQRGVVKVLERIERIQQFTILAVEKGGKINFYLIFLLDVFFSCVEKVLRLEGKLCHTGYI